MLSVPSSVSAPVTIDEVVDPAADDVGQAELVVEQRAGAEHQRADRQRADASPGREMSAVGDGHGAADAAGAAQARAAGDGGGARDRSVDQQPAAVDAGRAGIAAGGGQRGGAGTLLDDARPCR